MSEDSEKRGTQRMETRVRIRVCHDRVGEVMTYTRDISEDGVYILAQNLPLDVGDIVTGQVQDLPMEAPEVAMRIVRVEEFGMGLKYVNGDAANDGA
ncbi:MAG: PilZ domain-containing protein [Cellvibrionaceae bacterium]